MPILHDTRHLFSAFVIALPVLLLLLVSLDGSPLIPYVPPCECSPCLPLSFFAPLLLAELRVLIRLYAVALPAQLLLDSLYPVLPAANEFAHHELLRRTC